MAEDEVSLFDESFKDKKPAEKPAEAAKPVHQEPSAPQPPPVSKEPLPGGPHLSTADSTTKNVTTSVETIYEVLLENKAPEMDSIRMNIDIIYSAELGADAAEWTVNIDAGGVDTWKLTHTKQTSHNIDIPGGGSIKLRVMVGSPRGAKYGDTIRVVMTAVSGRDPAKYHTLTLNTTAKQSILVVKTQIGQERAVADSLASRGEPVGVLTIINPAPLRGYLLVEAMNTDRLVDIVKGIRKARGIVKGETSIKDIEHYLTPKPLVAGIVEGDIIELVAGPFKGEKARVRSIDETKEEITVELFEALVPMPVTVKGDSVRVIEKEK